MRELKVLSDRPLSVGGPGLAAAAFSADLVDELHLLVSPVAGAGTPSLPPGLRVGLELLVQRRFESGFVHLHYAVSSPR